MLDSHLLQTFRQLLDEAVASDEIEPTAMNLASADATGRVHSRIVLLKGVDARGFRFFTNYESNKGSQLQIHPQVALCFHWKAIRHGVQVRVEGVTERLSARESDAYFASRPRTSQLGAWASLQSQVLPDPGALEQRLAEFECQFAGVPVPRPPHWGGFLVEADQIEFWYGVEFRLHERIRWCRHDQRWTVARLYP